MKRIPRYLGTALAIVMISWLFYANLGKLPAIDLDRSGVRTDLTVAVSLYIGSQLLGAWAWKSTLLVFGAKPTAYRAESQLLVSQIGKYLPGNVGHFIGRFALAHRDGLATPVISLSLLLETVLTVGVALLIVAGLLVLMPDFVTGIVKAVPENRHYVLAGSTVLAALVACGILVNARHSGWKVPSQTLQFRPALVAFLILLHTVNFGVLGLSLFFVARCTAPGAAISVGTCMIVFASAWVTGFLTPGPPGGIGIRDSIITLGLGASIGPPAALVAALLHRAVSVLGDVLVFALGLLLRRTLDA